MKRQVSVGEATCNTHNKPRINFRLCKNYLHKSKERDKQLNRKIYQKNGKIQLPGEKNQKIKSKMFYL